MQSKQFYHGVKTSGKFSNDELHAYKTLNGFHLVIAHGFDSRQVMDSYDDATLKRDDVRLVCAKTKGQDTLRVQELDVALFVVNTQMVQM